MDYYEEQEDWPSSFTEMHANDQALKKANYISKTVVCSKCKSIVSFFKTKTVDGKYICEDCYADLLIKARELTDETV